MSLTGPIVYDVDADSAGVAPKSAVAAARPSRSFAVRIGSLPLRRSGRLFSGRAAISRFGLAGLQVGRGLGLGLGLRRDLGLARLGRRFPRGLGGAGCGGGLLALALERA